MDLSVLRDTPDLNLPDVFDVSLPDALDIDVADLAGQAVEFAGDVSAVVVKQGGRGARQVVRFTRSNPKATLGVIAIVVILIGLLAAKRNATSNTDLDAAR